MPSPPICLLAVGSYRGRTIVWTIPPRPAAFNAALGRKLIRSLFFLSRLVGPEKPFGARKKTKPNTLQRIYYELPDIPWKIADEG